MKIGTLLLLTLTAAGCGPIDTAHRDFYAGERRFVASHKCVVESIVPGHTHYDWQTDSVQGNMPLYVYRCDGVDDPVLIRGLN